MSSYAVDLAPGIPSPFGLPSHFASFDVPYTDGTTSTTFYAPLSHLAVLTCLDLVEERPNENDSWTCQWAQNSGPPQMFWGGGVGGGSAGSFYDLWRGQIVIPPGGELIWNVNFTMGSTSHFHLVANGYYMPLEPLPWFSGSDG